MRGVYPSGPSATATLLGSSPHARGLLAGPEARRGRRGIIPACAGFTWLTVPEGLDMGDHPRMRGVYPLDGLIVDRPTGSSPHARGLRGALGEDHAGWRIIPACAGFTPRRPHRPEDRSDHPRMRGVYATVMGNFFSESGSSPHARGLPPGGYLQRPRWSDHPRMRGVYLTTRVTSPSPGGSSPHARGLRQSVRCRDCAVVDHPRMRGVYFPARRA